MRPASGPDDIVTLAHGGGGRGLRALLEQHIAPAVGHAALAHDACLLAPPADSAPQPLGALAFTTDSFVVQPAVFPGGDIGRLAVCGTVNDLAMAGARPLALSLALILEEGLPLATLDRVLASAAAAAREAGVAITTGDTKVVPRGAADGLYLTTSGVGRVPPGIRIAPDRIQPGDAVLVSGDIGRHGAAILALREQIEGGPPSDVAPLAALVDQLLRHAPVHCLRDPTRGGLAAALAELAGPHDLVIDEARVPIDPRVRAATELFGLDPLQLACEGRLVAFVPADEADDALRCLRAHHPRAARVGYVEQGAGRVWLRDPFGGQRLLVRPWGDPLPRIC